MEILLFVVTLLPILGSLVQMRIYKKDNSLKSFVSILIASIEIIMCVSLFVSMIEKGTLYYTIDYLCGLGLSFKFDGFRAIHCLLGAFIWLTTGVFGKEYLGLYKNHTRYHIFNLITFGSTLGVFLSADLFTTFIFFEMMSIASYVLVAHDESKETLEAAQTYLVVAVLGGMVMLMGLFILYTQTDTLVISELYQAVESIQDKTMIIISGLCMLVGFGAKAGLYPLHIWLPKSYPAAPAPISAILSAILSKTGVYGMIVITVEIFRDNLYWAFMILCFAIVTMLLGGILALFSTNLKRTLACSSMSQIGFIAFGLAMSILLGHHNALAVRGTILHMINHSFIKLLLFMVAGIIFMNVKELDLNKIRGFGRKKPLLKGLFLTGALGVSGIPFFNGYVSKTLIHESIVEYIAITVNKGTYTLIEWLFIIAGGFTLAYMTKLFICIFVEKNEDEELQKQYDSNKQYMSLSTSVVLILCACCILGLGVIPNITSDAIANITQDFMHAHHLDHVIHYFSSINLIGGAKSIVIGIFVYVFFVRGLLMKKNHYQQVWPNWLDLEFLIYRPLIQYVLPFVFAFACRILASLPEFIMTILHHTLLKKKKINKANQQDYMPGELQTFSRTSVILSQIESSLSFGLLIAGLGIVFGMIYILISFF